ncbi:hypothetical protein HZS_1666 [Henneguya salminicola]|nr:hypothetical protein HZS_1666 [Henneguya salminicola]
MDDDEPLIIFPDISSSNGYSKTNSEPILQIETIDLFDPFKKVKNNTILPINQSTSAELTNNPSSDLNASKKPHQNNILEMDFFNQ